MLLANAPTSIGGLIALTILVPDTEDDEQKSLSDGVARKVHQQRRVQRRESPTNRNLVGLNQGVDHLHSASWVHVSIQFAHNQE